MKRYAALRAAMLLNGIDRKRLAEELELSLSTVNQRFSNPLRDPWRIDECYKALTLLGERPERLHVLFPPMGLDALPCP